MSFLMREIAGRIDHTLLAPEATAAEVDRTWREAISAEFAAVCVHGRWVERVRAGLEGTRVKTCAVADFPHGAAGRAGRAHQVASVVRSGAEEVDIVAPLAEVLSGNEAWLRADLKGVVEVARSVRDVTVIKVILETALVMRSLPAQEAEARLAAACAAARDAGVDYVKTSTGFHAAGGASSEAVRLLRKHAGPTMKVKASGGIRTLADIRAMLEAGAERIGCSRGMDIMQEVARAEREGRRGLESSEGEELQERTEP